MTRPFLDFLYRRTSNNRVSCERIYKVPVPPLWGAKDVIAMQVWKHKLPICYFVCPDGRTETAPAVDEELLRTPLVCRLLRIEDPS